MKNLWTEKHLNLLLRQGKIRGYTVQTPMRNLTGAPATPQKSSREKNWLQWNLKIWAEQNKLLLLTEYEFHKERHWRFDWCFPEIKVAVEYEGIFNGGKAHTSIEGVMRDIAKYNAASADSWRIIRITAKDYKTVLSQLKNYLK